MGNCFSCFSKNKKKKYQEQNSPTFSVSKLQDQKNQVSSPQKTLTNKPNENLLGMNQKSNLEQNIKKKTDENQEENKIKKNVILKDVKKAGESEKDQAKIEKIQDKPNDLNEKLEQNKLEENFILKDVKNDLPQKSPIELLIEEVLILESSGKDCLREIIDYLTILKWPEEKIIFLLSQLKLIISSNPNKTETMSAFLKCIELINKLQVPFEPEVLQIFGNLNCKEWRSSLCSIFEKLRIPSYIQMVIEDFYELHEDFHELKSYLHSLLKQGWEKNHCDHFLFEYICKFKKQNLKVLNQIVYLMVGYQLKDEHFEEVRQCIQNSTYENLLSSIYQIILNKCIVPNPIEKDLDTVISELLSMNDGQGINKNLIKAKTITKIRQQYEDYLMKLESKSQIGSNAKLIKDYLSEDINEWSNLMKKQKIESEQLIEILGIVARASFLNTKYQPRAIQILANLILLNAKKKKGRLLQIYTGEGKSTTISLFAAIKVFQGNKVDIVSSSEVLALRDAKEKEAFYKMLNISCASNSRIHGEEEQKALQQCYACDIVYGDAGSFEGDILRQIFKDKSEFVERKPNVIIVDEVDSMMIDAKGHSTMLGQQTPGMSEIINFMKLLWKEVLRVFPLIQDDGSCTISNPLNENEEMCIKYDHVEDHLIYYAKAILETEGKNMHISNYRIPYVEHQIPRWVKSALHVKRNLKIGIHYIVQNDDIAPIDYINTGVIQERMHWSDGIHQFLQMQEGLTVTPETITTNFFSNLKFFKRYGKNIFGMTGTLGTVAAQESLAEIYNVDFAIVPPFKMRQLRELPYILCESEHEWLSEIILMIETFAGFGRVILVISENMRHCFQIKSKLQSTKIKNVRHIYSYERNDDNNVENYTFQKGDVIVATNLAGRGTDIKISKEVENNGGLHSIVTFLPLNLRVEEQAFGRAARQGKPGTANLILDFDSDNIGRGLDQSLFLLQCMLKANLRNGSSRELITILQNTMDLKKERMEKEKTILESAKSEAQHILLRDDLFEKFCAFVTNLPEIKSNLFAQKDLEERWGLWLKEREDIQDREKLFADFDIFANQILKEYKFDSETKKLSYEVQNPKNGMKEVIQMVLDGKLEESIEKLKTIKNANNKDPMAAYNLVQLKVMKIDQFSKQEVLEDIKNTKALLDDIITQNAALDIKIENPEFEKNTFEKPDNEKNDKDYEKENSYKVFNSITYKQQYNPSMQNQVQQKEELETQKYNECLIKLKENLEQIKEALNSEEKMDFEIAKPQDFYEGCDKRIMETMISDGFYFHLKTKPKISWGNVFAIGFLGIAQIVVGVAVVAYSAGGGVPIGTSLIFEGVSDILTAIQVATGSKFEWSHYAVHKIINFSLTCMTAGWDGCKDAVQAAGKGAAFVKNGLKTVTQNQIGKLALKKGAEKLIKNKVAEGLEKKTAENVVRNRFKEIGKDLALNLGKAAVSSGYEYVSDEHKRKLLDKGREELLKICRDNLMALMKESDCINGFISCVVYLKNSIPVAEKLPSYFSKKALQTIIENKAANLIDNICLKINNSKSKQGTESFEKTVNDINENIQSYFKDLIQMIPEFIQILTKEINEYRMSTSLEDVSLQQLFCINLKNEIYQSMVGYLEVEFKELQVKRVELKNCLESTNVYIQSLPKYVATQDEANLIKNQLNEKTEETKKRAEKLKLEQHIYDQAIDEINQNSNLIMDKIMEFLSENIFDNQLEKLTQKIKPFELCLKKIQDPKGIFDNAKLPYLKKSGQEKITEVAAILKNTPQDLLKFHKLTCILIEEQLICLVFSKIYENQLKQYSQHFMQSLKTSFADTVQNFKKKNADEEAAAEKAKEKNKNAEEEAGAEKTKEKK